MKTRGRPKKDIKWPEGVEFTTKNIRESSEKTLSAGLIHAKIKEAIESGQIKLVGKTSSPTKGRPKNIYRRIK